MLYEMLIFIFQIFKKITRKLFLLWPILFSTSDTNTKKQNIKWAHAYDREPINISIAVFF